MDVTQWGSLVTNLGIGGTMAITLVWFLRHVLTVTLPEMTGKFMDELRVQRDSRLQQHQHTRTDHAQLVDRMNHQFEQVMLRLGQAEANAISRIEKAAETLQKAAQDNRHVIRNLDTSIGILVELYRQEHPPKKPGGKP